MFDRVAELLAEFLQVDKSVITRDTDIKDDLGADSLVIVEMLFTLEEEMGISIPDDVVESLSNVGKLVDYLENNKK